MEDLLLPISVSLEGTGLESLCTLLKIAKEYIQKIEEIKKLSFSEKEIGKRKEILNKLYDNEKNA